MSRTTPTTLSLLATLCGMTLRETAALIGTDYNTLASYACGRRVAPYSVLLELATHHKQIQDISGETLSTLLARDDVPREHGARPLRLKLSRTDAEARRLGFASVGAHRAILARVTAALVLKGHDIAIVPCRDSSQANTEEKDREDR